MAFDTREQFPVAVAGLGVDRHEPSRQDSIDEAPQVLHRSMAGGMEVGHRDLVLGQEGRELGSGSLTEVAIPERPRGRAGIGERPSADELACGRRRHVEDEPFRVGYDLLEEDPVRSDAVDSPELAALASRA